MRFVQRLIALRSDHPVFRRRNFFQGRRIRGAEIKDIAWFRPDGQEMSDDEWNQEFARCLGISLTGEALDELDERGQRVHDDNFLLLINAHHEEIPFVLPARALNSGWVAIVDTSCQTASRPDSFYSTTEPYPLQARSLALLVQRSPERVRKYDRRRSPAE
jgi:glycogen operon protein